MRVEDAKLATSQAAETDDYLRLDEMVDMVGIVWDECAPRTRRGTYLNLLRWKERNEAGKFTFVVEGWSSEQPTLLWKSLCRELPSLRSTTIVNVVGSVQSQMIAVEVEVDQDDFAKMRLIW